jgi:hypothetical protein
LPPNQTVTATRAAGATDPAGFTATATDAVTAHPTITYAVGNQVINSSYVFPIGTTTVTVTATDAAGNKSSGNFTVTVQTNSGTLPTLHAIEGDKVREIANFTVADKTAPASSFTASINWGDGHTSRAAVTGSNGSFKVKGKHAYAEDGTYSVIVSLTEGSTLYTMNGTVDVKEAKLVATGNPIDATNGVAFSDQVASFTENSLASASEFRAVIDWGDGHTSTGTVVKEDDHFTILGSHTYVELGSYVVKITLTDDTGSATTITTTANVSSDS